MDYDEAFSLLHKTSVQSSIYKTMPFFRGLKQNCAENELSNTKMRKWWELKQLHKVL